MKTERNRLVFLAAAIVVSSVVGLVFGEPVLHYELDSTDGTIVVDSSGNGFDGTVIYAVPKWYEQGRYGACLDFDGTYGVEVPVEAFSRIDKELTISVWVKGNSSDTSTSSVIFQAGAHDDGDPYMVSIYVRWRENGNVGFSTGFDDDDDVDCDVGKDEWVAGWNHLCFVKDASKGIQRIYVNGQQAAENTDAFEPMAGIKKARLGMAPDRFGDQFWGKVDDFVVYDKALSAEEIVELYRPGSFWRILSGVCTEYERLMREDARKAVGFIGDKIEACEKWKKKEGSEYPGGYARKRVNDLRYLLAGAMMDAGFSNDDVGEAYHKALRHGRPSLSTCGGVLLWLYENANAEEQEHVVRSFISDNEDYLKKVAAKAESMRVGGEAEGAIGFIEAMISMFGQLRQAHRYADLITDDSLPAIYIQLAKAQEAAGVSKKTVVATYGHAFEQWRRERVELWSSALIWLLKNDFRDECAEIMKSFMERRGGEIIYKRVVSKVFQELESSEKWGLFEKFLDTVVGDEEYPFELVKFVDSCVKGEPNEGGKRYHSYLADKIGLKPAMACLAAQEYASSKNYYQAAQSYAKALGQCEVGHSKLMVEFELCKSLFRAGQYRKAAARLAEFVARNKSSNRALVQKAILMQGHLAVQLGDLDKAMGRFFILMMEYPEMSDISEVNFFVSYCYMLQGKFGIAKKFFENLMRDYPGSSYAVKARRCVQRIDEIDQFE